MIDEDEPHHGEMRGLINRGFTPRMVKKWEEVFKQITDDTLDKYVEENPKFLLMMYTKTCEKCKAMMPVFAEASGKASDANTGFAAADCATDPKTCIKFGIKNPKVLRSAVLKFVDGGAAVAYKGKKDAKGLSDFAVEMDEEPGKDEL